MKPRNTVRFGWKAIGAVAFVAVGLVIVGASHESRAQLLTYLPFVLILACPLTMLIMMGSMGSMHQNSERRQLQDGMSDVLPNTSNLTRDEQLWALRNEITHIDWRQESLRRDLERLEHERSLDPDITATSR